MSSPRIVSAVLIGFALLAVCFWYYGSVSDPAPTQPAPRGVASSHLFPLATSKPAAGDPAHDGEPSTRRNALGRPAGDIAGPQQRAIGRLVAEQAENVLQDLEDAANRFRSNFRGSAAGRFIVGIESAFENQHDAAIARYDAALRRAPDDPIILAAKAKSLLAVGRRDDAEALYQALVKRDPEDAAAGYNLAVLLIRQGRLGEASEALRNVVRVAPGHGPAQYNLASLAQRAGRLFEARQAWEAYSRLEPDVPSGWFHLGVIWMDYGRPRDAAMCFSRYSALASLDPLGHINLGMALAALGDDASALESFRVANDLDPCNPLILANLYTLHEHLAARDAKAGSAHRSEADRLAVELSSLEGGPIAIPAIVGSGSADPGANGTLNAYP